MSMRTIELGVPITDAAVDAKTHDDLLHAGNPESALPRLRLRRPLPRHHQPATD
jgi:hypothetical protein